MNDAVKNALRIAQRTRRPIRMHQTLARHGYATDGEVEGDVQFAPDDQQQEFAPPQDTTSFQQPDETSQQKFLESQLQPEEAKPSPLVEQYAEPTAQAALEANTIKPMSDASAFEQQVLSKNEPQLPQYDREAKERMQNAATEALHMGSYFTPAAPAVAAYDMYQGLKSGDPLEAGMSAVGLPGRLPKAAALAASAMMPSSAEASPIKDATRLAKELLTTKAKNLMQLPDLRHLPVKEGTKIAQKDLHLIPSGERSEGYFIGGPRNVQSQEDLMKVRKDLDKFIAKDPRGGDWYDRYRTGLTEVTGGEPKSVAWAPKMQAQWSAGVSPEGELGFTLREMNAALAGNPVKSARPAQHKAFMAALEANDPNKLQLGKKTGYYAHKIDPIQGVPSATSVNDFRHARNLQYTEPSGEPQRNAMTEAQHKFMDYETAAAVGRANKRNLAGRSDWTGEQLQAAPWVRQKAQDLVEQRPALTQRHVKDLTAKYMSEGLSKGAAEKQAKQEAPALAYEDAFKLANTTIADFFPKHTFSATSEQIPGVVTGHLPGAAAASQELREAYSADPRSTWGIAPGNRSGIYGGLYNYTPEGVRTGPGMYVRPSIKSQGMFTPEGSKVPEFNPGEVDRPLIGFKSGKVKSIPEEDRNLLEAGEATRAYIDAQEAGAGHINWEGGAPGQSNSFTVPLNRKATPEEMQRLKEAVAPHGYSDVVDTGNGLTITNFENPPSKMSTKQKNAVIDAIQSSAPEGATGVRPVKTDSIYQGYADEWQKGLGSGAATTKLLEAVNKNPVIREAFDRNEFIPQKALANIERDNEWMKHFGTTREDIQNARKIIGEGPGWVGRLEKALKSGAILPAIGTAMLMPQMLHQAAPSAEESGPGT